MTTSKNNPKEKKPAAKPVNPYQPPQVPSNPPRKGGQGPLEPHRGAERLRSGLIAAGLFYLPTLASLAAVNLLSFPPEPFMFVVPALGIVSSVLALLGLRKGGEDLSLMRLGKMNPEGSNPTTIGNILNCLVLIPVLGALGLFLALVAICFMFPPNFHGP